MKAIITSFASENKTKELNVPEIFTVKTYKRFNDAIQKLEDSHGKDEHYCDYELKIEYNGKIYFELEEFAIAIGLEWWIVEEIK